VGDVTHQSVKGAVRVYEVHHDVADVVRAAHVGVVRLKVRKEVVNEA
jgi:hypothetical protein